LRSCKQPTSFSRPDWIFDIKYDGFRSLAYIEKGRCRLTSRKGVVYSRFKDLAQAISDEVDAEDAVLDGEIVVLDAEGKPRLYDLMESKGTPVYAAFDLVWLDGEDLRDYPLWERKMLLEGCLRQPPERILYVNHVEEQVPMRKGVAFLFRYRDASHSANSRYLDALALVGDPRAKVRELDRLTRRRTQANGRSAKAFNPLAPHLIPQRGDAKRESAKVSRVLHCLHAHRLIAKYPHSRRWRTTRLGRRLMATAIQLREVNFPQLLADAA